MAMQIPLMKPHITPAIKQAVNDVLDSGYLTEGPITKAFENEFKAYIGCQHALAVTSCTTGLEMALRALGVGPGDEVIVPDYTYPATASVVDIVGAKIVIVDISKDTMLIDYDQIEQAITPKTKAIIPVSLFGNPLDYNRLNAIKKKHNLFIIEDAACSIGAEWHDEKVGNFADISVFSLHPRKFITTGEGGMITTNNQTWADWMNSYKHFGMGCNNSRLSTSFDMIGTNYKLSNILAAVGLEQLKEVKSLLNKRLKLADNYTHLLTQAGITVSPTTAAGKHTRQSYCVFVEQRDLIMQQLRAEGIEVQIGTYSLHQHPAFAPSDNCRIVGNMANSLYAFEHCLTLPLYNDMTEQEQQTVVGKLASQLA